MISKSWMLAESRTSALFIVPYHILLYEMRGNVYLNDSICQCSFQDLFHIFIQYNSNGETDEAYLLWFIDHMFSNYGISCGNYVM
jgi:hypothetical protein